jgi:hypothetical protein
MNRKIYIMAQGKGARWKSADMGYKQLLPITKLGVGYSTIIGRTIYQLWGENNTLIAPEDFPINVMHQTFKNPGEILHGIWLTYKELSWDYDRVIILLGDVIFSNYAIKKIFADDRPFSFYGRLGENKVTGKSQSEIFGISIYREKHKEVADACYWTWRMMAMHNLPAKLWTLYHAFDKPELLVQFYDYTDDVDFPEEWELLHFKLQQCVAEDDANANRNSHD